MNWFDCKKNNAVKRTSCKDGTENGTISRLDRMVAAMHEVIGKLSNDFNVGLMRFGGADGGRVIYPLRDLAEPGVREDLAHTLDDIVAIVGTPTVGALEEAWRYYGGQEVKHGLIRANTPVNNSWDNIRGNLYSRVSHPGTYEGGTPVNRADSCDDILNDTNCENEIIERDIDNEPVMYVSPIVSECQSNYSIVLSDGSPWTGPGSDRTVLPQYDDTIKLGVMLNEGDACDSKGVSEAELCGEEFAEAMYKGDILATMPGIQNVVTHTIGFNIKSNWFRDVAIAGGGDYLTAESSADLIGAIDKITSQVSESGTTVVAPGVTIDQFTRLSHRRETYLALFKPQSTANWVGNLKKYSFSGEDPSLKDQLGNEAIDDAGQFIANSQSFWSASSDGADVLFGGAASNLDLSTRRIVSNLDVDPNRSLLASVVPEDNPNEIHEDNDLLTAAMLGIDEPAIDTPAGEVCYFDNSDWTWSGDDQGVNFRDCRQADGRHNFAPKASEGHRNRTSAISVGAGVHTMIYKRLNGNGQSMCISAGTDVSNLGVMNNSASSFEVLAGGLCPGDIPAASRPNREMLLSWLKGVDIKDEDDDKDFTDARNHIGDPLHSSPVVVTYKVEEGEVADEENPNSLVFFGTNEGFLHAIDTVNGSEEYAFMPQELLQNVASLFANAELNRDDIKPYGLDGNITLRTIDINKDGVIDSTEGDKAYLYMGMRRGGRSYYALDVSEKSQPKFLWSRSSGSGDYAELGQSWSKPIVSKIKIDTVVKDVLVFAGGYDPQQDDVDERTADSMGRAIYIVDADDGALIWSGSNAEKHPTFTKKHYEFEDMDYSIPADIAIVPNQSTGYLSQMYVGDMGGRIWRFDIHNGNTLENLVSGGIIADFGEDSTVTGARRFYSTPDLSLSKINGELKINISIGSGYRAHPLNRDVDDKYILLRYPFSGYGTDYGLKGSGESIKLSNLFDTTNNVIGQGEPKDRKKAQEELAQREGWYISMERDGEKIINRSSTFQEVLRFVSYLPVESTDPCEPGLGKSYFYAVNLADGTPFEGYHGHDEDDDYVFTKEDRVREIPTPGIAPPVTTIFVEHNGAVTPTDVSGVNKIHEWENLDLVKRWFWAESPD